MIATYQGYTKLYTIEPIKQEGEWLALIDGEESPVTAKYKGWAIKRAMQFIDEQERAKLLREVML